MPNQLPLTIQMGPLPPEVQWTPQQLADAIAFRLKIVTQGTFALFVAGSTAPTSNVGPWARNDNSWYFWDVISGSYKPQILAPESLGYTVGPNPPDPAIYNFWIETTVGGSPLSVKIYYGAAWVDIYAAKFANYSTTTEMNTAIANAISGVSFANYLAQAGLSAPQVISVDAAAHLVEFNSAILNPAPAPFNTTTHRYVAPAAGVYSVDFTSQVTNNTGVAASMEAQITLFKNGIATAYGATEEVPSPSGGRWFPKMPPMLIELAVNDYLELWITLQDGTNTGNCDLEQTYFNIIRVSA